MQQGGVSLMRLTRAVQRNSLMFLQGELECLAYNKLEGEDYAIKSHTEGEVLARHLGN